MKRSFLLMLGVLVLLLGMNAVASPCVTAVAARLLSGTIDPPPTFILKVAKVGDDSGTVSPAETVHVKLDFVRMEPARNWFCPYGTDQYLTLGGSSKRGLVVPEEGQGPDTKATPTGLVDWVKSAVASTQKDILFGVLPLEGQRGGYAFAIRRAAGSEDYGELCIDCNEDGTISSGERFTAAPETKPQMSMHPGPMLTPVETAFTLETPFGQAQGDPINYVFQVRVRVYRERADLVQAHFSPLCCRKGSVTVNGTAYSVALMDLNMNGRFNDMAAFKEGQWVGDGVVFMPVGDTEPDIVADRELLNSIRMAGDKPFRLSASANGAEITLEPADLPCGRLKMDPAPQVVCLAGELGPFCVRNVESATLPAGAYAPMRISYAATTKEGVSWTVDGGGFWGQTLTKFEVKPGKTAKMPYGAPFVSRVAIQPNYGRGIQVVLTGQGGERYDYGCTTRDGKWVPTADVVLKTRNGEEVARLKRIQQTSVDAIPPDYSWDRPFPKEGLVATCDLRLPWKVKQEKAVLTGDRK